MTLRHGRLLRDYATYFDDPEEMKPAGVDLSARHLATRCVYTTLLFGLMAAIAPVALVVVGVRSAWRRFRFRRELAKARAR